MKFPPDNKQWIICDLIKCIHNKDTTCIKPHITLKDGCCIHYKPRK